MIKIDLASQRGEHLTEMVNVRELRDGDGSSAAGETLEQATVTHQGERHDSAFGPEQLPVCHF